MNRLRLSDIAAQIKDLNEILLDPNCTYMQSETITNRIAELQAVRQTLRDNSVLKLVVNDDKKDKGEQDGS